MKSTGRAAAATSATSSALAGESPVRVGADGALDRIHSRDIFPGAASASNPLGVTVGCKFGPSEQADRRCRRLPSAARQAVSNLS